MLLKEWVAMLLAGGQGSRLGCLTKRIAKPAVSFGGKYRIIDFSLSNCNNSGIDTVGVLTQYKPLLLNSYIGIGSAWDLDIEGGGVFVLPPYVGEKGGQWYKGTAHAIGQNIDFIDQYNPQYVLVISGDHIYKMDYSVMLEFHKNNQADVTIAAIQVPWEEACRFGILNTDENGRIEEFDEKPKNPRSNLASMGIYIFNWPVLKEYLIQDSQDPESANDFGKNVLPKMLKDGLRMFAYRFQGYWKDVGTIESYYTANMDLLADNPEFDIFDENLKVFSKSPILPPHFIAAEAKVKNSLVPDGCVIFGEVEHSVLFPGVYVGPGAVIKDSILLPDVRVEGGCLVNRAIIGESSVIGPECQIGYGCNETFNPAEITVIGDYINFPKGVVIEKGSSISEWQDGELKIS
ncbi:MAG TPA: glucose-1-phosphate adenylyltransferase [Firmicutes bacterium]|jgi:glucose-1-phosphate adenylyltransferase|nr:glucose-1-phosphate adenylyltransferase [Bacillota bacterium]